MPSEQPNSNSQSQTRPALPAQRSSGSDSPFGSPHGKAKVHGHKHVVGGARGVHSRVPSSKALHKSTGSKVHIAPEECYTDLKKSSRNSSATSLKKNSSHVSLKRNRSAADIIKRTKSSQGQIKQANSVHFEIGGQDRDQDPDQDEGWEEASQSASPALSRVVSSGKASAETSVPQSPVQSQPNIQATSQNQTTSVERHSNRGPSADAKTLTERLLQRTPSRNTTKMSLATATPATSAGAYHDLASPEKDRNSPSNFTPNLGTSNAEVVSRFVGGSGTPSENQSFLHSRRETHNYGAHHHVTEDMKRAQSMGNLTAPQTGDSDFEEIEESALAPRSRKPSNSHGYVPPQQSRTQQKLWLQRASSNIEPQQLVPGITSIHSGNSLVGAAYDGRDPRIKIQLERTGLEYLVVRRYQDPVGRALKRLNQFPGMDKNRRIPPAQDRKRGDAASQGRSQHGLSQSVRSERSKVNTPPKPNTINGSGTGPSNTRTSFEIQNGSPEDGEMSSSAGRARARGEGDDGVGAILRSMWEKSMELSASSE